MTVLQSLPPEICSLICQDPILERLDLNSICFISHAFRNEARRELSSRFPCLQGADRVKTWCLSLQSSPHLAIKIKGLVLLLPQLVLPALDVFSLKWALHMCVNLKDLVVVFQDSHCRPGLQEMSYLSNSTHTLLFGLQFKLTKFVNGYFPQDNPTFTQFLQSQPDLESLELHSGNTTVYKSSLPLHHLKTLGCPPQFLNQHYSVTRLRLDLENSTDDDCEIDILGRVLKRNLTRNMKSLAISLRQSQSHFPEIIRAIAVRHIYIQHLEIHQFVPTQVRP